MEEYISRREHDEFARRMEEEDHRQNRRLELLEDNVRQIGGLTMSVEKMACTMESMVKEIHSQGERLDSIEQEPADQWQRMKQKAVETAVTVVVTALVIGIVTMAAMYIK